MRTTIFPHFRIGFLLVSLSLMAGHARADACNDRWTGAFSEDYDGMHPNWSGYCHVKNIPERSCNNLEGKWIGDSGSGYTVCHFKKGETAQRDSRDDYEYHERPPAPSVPDPYRAPTYVPPANNYVPPSSNSDEDDDAASEERANRDSERFQEAEQRRALEEKNRQLQEQVQRLQQAQQPKQRKWRALAVGVETNIFSADVLAAGESFNYDTQEAAKARALLECRKKLPHKCSIESAWNSGCRWMYYATGRDRLTWGTGPTKQIAMNNCASNRGQSCNGGPMGGCEPD